jgi:cytochrome c
LNRLGLGCLLLLTIAAVGQAAEGGTQRGKTLLEAMCARCHATGRAGRSPHPDAPPFPGPLVTTNFTTTTLHRDWKTVSHPDMPTFHFSREDAVAAVDYLRLIQAKGKPKAAR